MQTAGPIAHARRRTPLLAAVGLLLLLLASAPAAGSHVDASRGETVTTAVGHVAVVARTAPERVLGAHRLPLHGHATADGALATALLLAVLLGLRTRTRGDSGRLRPALLLATAGRGPPLTS